MLQSQCELCLHQVFLLGFAGCSVSLSPCTCWHSNSITRAGQLSEFTLECPNLDHHSDLSPLWPGDGSCVCRWPKNPCGMGRSHVPWETSMAPGSKGCFKSKSHLSLSRNASVPSSCAQPWSWLVCFPSKGDKNRQLSWPLGLNLSYLTAAQ